MVDLQAGGLPDVLAAHLLAAVRIDQRRRSGRRSCGWWARRWPGCCGSCAAAPRPHHVHRRWPWACAGCSWPGPSCCSAMRRSTGRPRALRWPSCCRGWGCWRWWARDRCRPARLPWRRSVGLGLLLWALLGHPLLAGLAGRPWSQAEVFGLAPDPTAIGTLGWLLLLQGCGAAARALLRGLWLVPLAWCTVSAATLGTMGAVAGTAAAGGGAAGRGGRAPALRLRCARADRAPGRRAAR